MRYLLLFPLLLFIMAVQAQTGFTENVGKEGFYGNNLKFQKKDFAEKKWFVSQHHGISAGYSYLYGGINGTFVSAPIGLQLNRRLNNNLYSFAGVSVAPVFLNLNPYYLFSGMNKNYQVNSLYTKNSLGFYQKAELGLMYVNDTKTFSISGSIGVQRSNYPIFLYPQINSGKQNPLILLNN